MPDSGLYPSEPETPDESPMSTGQAEVILLQDIKGRLADLVQKATETNELLGALAQIALGVASIDVNLATFLQDWLAANATPSGPVSGSLTIQGETMGLTVDTTPGSESLGFQFDDDHGNATSAPTGDGSGVVVVLASGDSTQATVGDVVVGADAAGNPTYTAPITVVTTVPGSVAFTASPGNTSGAPLTEDDGVTPFPAVDALTVPITAGDPVEGSLSVTP